jgi:hypothetical protein
MNPFMDQAIPVLRRFYNRFASNSVAFEQSSTEASSKEVLEISSQSEASSSKEVRLRPKQNSLEHVAMRKQHSLQRLRDYLLALSRFPEAIASIPGAKGQWILIRNIGSVGRVMTKIISSSSNRRRFMVISPLHRSLFYYKQDRGERTPVRKIEIDSIREFRVRESKSGRPLLEMNVRCTANDLISEKESSVSGDAASSTNVRVEFELKEDALEWVQRLKSMQPPAQLDDDSTDMSEYTE